MKSNNKVYFDNQLDNAVIEGLKRKGFEFQSRKEIEEFVIANCTCVDYTHKGVRVYSVNGIPYLQWNYDAESLSYI